MASLQWSPSLAIGVPKMDVEHQQLIQAMHRIEELAGKNSPKAAVDAAIQRLVQWTREHFAHEEAHMLAVGFPDRERHARIHADLLAKVGQHYQTFQAGTGQVAPEFLAFLSFWLKSHIQGIDRKYAEHGTPPAQPKPKAPAAPLPGKH